MTWNRYGSEFTRDRRWDGVPYEARWHYLAVVAECSDSERYDCRIPLRLAERASDVADAAAATAALVAAGFALIEGHDFIIVGGEERHMPPESLRDKKRKEDQRRWTADTRRRKCEAGEHDQHCPKSCPMRSGKGPGKASGKALPKALGNASGNAVRGETESPEVSEGLDSMRGKALGKPLPQNRTEQNRTALVEVSSQEGEVRSDNCPDCSKPFGPLVWCCKCGEVA